MYQVALGEGDLTAGKRNFGSRLIVLGLSPLTALGLLGFLLQSGTTSPSPEMRRQALTNLSELVRIRADNQSFSAGASGVWLLQDGFHQPDSEGALMSQDSATIRFDTGDEEPVSVSLLVSAFPYDGSPSVSMSLSSRIDDVHVELAGVELVTVALDGESFQEIHLGCRVRQSQFDLGVGSDLRPQCLRVLEMRVSMERS